MGRNVGCRDLRAMDAGAAIPIRLLYPTTAEERPERLGPYVVSVASDAPVDGEALRLVVVSHGTGGSSLSHRDLAAHLARAGFLVALVEHPGNNRDDNALAGTAAILENRPRQIRLAIDAVFADPLVGGRLCAEVGMIGHSLGGYTALAVAGGKPSAFAHESADGVARAVPVTPDPRLRALVLLTPAAAWYMAPGALSQVTAPMLILTGEHDQFTPAWHAELIKAGAPPSTRIDHRVIPGAGHFSFQSVYPPQMRAPDFMPAHDPPGFDRAALLEGMNADVEAFLRRAL